MIQASIYSTFRALRNVNQLFKENSVRKISSTASVNGLDVENKNQVLWLKFNRPNKLNAITSDMYEAITENLIQANKDNSVKAVVLTGEGEFYSSGNDLTNLLKASKHPDGMSAGLHLSKNILIKFIDSFIDLEKLLIAAVNGPAIGIPVTTLGLCDYVIASDKATFSSPFTALGQCPEACSSYTFPLIMGPSHASEFLLLNKTLNANLAMSYGLVSRVVEHTKFSHALDDLLYGRHGIVSTCYPNALKIGKSLIKSPELKQKLRDVNRLEAEELCSCWLGKECQDAVQKFMQRQK